MKFKILGRNEVPTFADWGTFYRTIALDPSVYLHFLQSKCLSLGVTFRRTTVDHIQDAFFISRDISRSGLSPTITAEVVVNCTGLLASRLGGVMDEAVTPVRGQLVIVENESCGMFSLSGDATMDEEIGENCYIIDRPAGKCILLRKRSSVMLTKVMGAARLSAARTTTRGITSLIWHSQRGSCSARSRCAPALSRPAPG